MSRAPITAKGAERLREELQRLKSVERPRIIDAIAEARAHGDLKENAEYHAAREQQSFNEGRIAELESVLSNAQVIDVSKLNVGDKVVFGATVELEAEDTSETVTYQIVGDAEADIEHGRISVTAGGKALPCPRHHVAAAGSVSPAEPVAARWPRRRTKSRQPPAGSLA